MNEYEYELSSRWGEYYSPRDIGDNEMSWNANKKCIYGEDELWMNECEL